VDLGLIQYPHKQSDNSISDADISLPGFEVPIRRDRNCSGGGIIFYYKSFVNVDLGLIQYPHKQSIN
jgi:hypothetical protein